MILQVISFPAHTLLSPWGLALLACALLQGCSPDKAQGAVPSGGAGAVSIVREKQPEFPAKYAAAIREVQARCFAGKAAVAAAQGWAYDPASERLTDAEILALDTERTEEYFDGKKYAKLVSGKTYDASSVGVSREESCKPTSLPFKTVEIHDGACNVLQVEYDLAQHTGRRIQTANACDTPDDAPEQSGEAVAVAGTNVQCKWTPAGPVVTPLGNIPRVAECTLLPSPIHAGTGRPLVAIRKLPDFLRTSTTPLPGMQAMDMQSLATVEQAVAVTLGSPIAPDKFVLPADAAGFALAN